MKIEIQRISQFSQLASLIKSKQGESVENSEEQGNPSVVSSNASEDVLGKSAGSADAAGSEAA
jgi:hypothetical protein